MTAPTSTRRTCTALNAAGERCGQTVGQGVDFCLFHDPARAEEATQARNAGREKAHAACSLRAAEARARRAFEASEEPPPLPLGTIQDLIERTAWIHQRVACGKMEVKTGEFELKTIQQLERLFKVRDLEAEIKRLSRIEREWRASQRGRT